MTGVSLVQEATSAEASCETFAAFSCNFTVDIPSDGLDNQSYIVTTQFPYSSSSFV